MTTVDLDELENAMMMVGDGFDGAQAWVCRDTGKVFVRYDGADPEAEPLPADIDESERYIAVPGARDLDLGTPLVYRFVEQELPDEFETVYAMFGRKGAYRKFSDFLDCRDARDKWHAFRDAETKAALLTWCEDHDLKAA